MEPPNTPILRLPPELLALTFKRLDTPYYIWEKKQHSSGFDCIYAYPERIILALTQKYWGSPPGARITPNILLKWAAEEGLLSLMHLAKREGATDFNSCVYRGACRADIECLETAKKWGPPISTKP